MSDAAVLAGTDTVVVPGGVGTVLAEPDAVVVDAAILADADAVLADADAVVQEAGLTATGVLTVVVPDPAPAWTDLGQDAVIAATVVRSSGNPSAGGRVVSCLAPYAGKVYLGYGDYTDNTGPTDLRTYEPGVGFATAVSSVGTEAFLEIRQEDGDLYAVCVDATSGTSPDYVRFDGSTYTTASGATPDGEHLYGVAVFGGDLYVCGQRGTTTATGSVWRNAAGTWSRPYDNASYGRIYLMFVLGGYLWAQPFSSSAGPAPHPVRSSDGTTWGSVGTVDLLPQGKGTGWRPHYLGSSVAYATTHVHQSSSTYISTATRYLTSFDGTGAATEHTAIGAIYDLFSDGTTLYVLTQAGEVLTTDDLSTFDTLTDEAPSAGRSICALDGAVYVGTTDSHLWRFA